MDLEFEDNKIILEKELNELDELALYFSEQLTSLDISHVFLSGYVAILFGRNRASEDIDVICNPIPYDRFKHLWDNVYDTLECIITSDPEDAFNNYLSDKIAIRFAYKGEIIPNIEMKFASNVMHKEAIENAINVVLNGRHIPISPLESQIAYKLFMRSEKDIEDARFLFKLFEEQLKKKELLAFIKALQVPEDKARYFLGWSE